MWDGTLPHLADLGVTTTFGGTRQGYAQGPEDQKLRMLERSIDLGDDGRYLVTVAGDALEIDAEIREFNRSLLLTFGALAIMLLLITMFQVRFGLAPLKRISQSLAAIRSGTSERLEGRFPDEIEPLARETNALIDANREIVERARTHVGNLAHALKTPAVGDDERGGGAQRRSAWPRRCSEQTAIMRDQVARHLERARLATRAAVVGSITDVMPVVTALARTMEKIHRARDIAVDVESAGRRIRFQRRAAGPRRDGRQSGRQCRQMGAVAGGDRGRDRTRWRRRRPGMVRIIVDDDGPGLHRPQREQVARRGRRLDETKPGLRPRPFHRGRTRQSLRRQPHPRHVADGRPLRRRTGCCRGVRGFGQCDDPPP